MIAARWRVAIFFLLFLVGDFWVGIFGWGFLGALGALGATRSTRIFFEGIFFGGILFLGGGGGCFGL